MFKEFFLSVNSTNFIESDGVFSVGPPSPSVGATDSEVGSLQRSQTFGQKIMGNMRDNLLTRSFTSKPKNFTSDAAVPSSPSKVRFSNVYAYYESLFLITS